MYSILISLRRRMFFVFSTGLVFGSAQPLTQGEDGLQRNNTPMAVLPGQEILYQPTIPLPLSTAASVLPAVDPKTNPMEAYRNFKNMSNEEKAAFRQACFINLNEIGDNGVVPADKLYIVIPYEQASAPRVKQIFIANPDKVAVVDFGDQTQTPDNFLQYNTTLKNIIFADSQITKIGRGFLSDCTNLNQIDFSGLRNVVSIENGFLYHCNRLTSVDLFSLNNVTSIGDYSLSECGLTSVNLSPLNKVTSIGNYFLSGCPGLTSVNLSPLSKVTSIGDYFLSECGLTSVSLSPLSKVTSIGDHFLFFCTHLTSLDLSPLKNLTNIGCWFLRNCRRLVEINLSGLNKVESIGDCLSLIAIPQKYIFLVNR